MPKKGSKQKNVKKRTLRDRAYDATPARRKARNARNKARKLAGLPVGDPRDAGHKKPIRSGGKTTKGNVVKQSAKKNRSEGGKSNSKAHLRRAGRKGGKA